MYWNNLGVDTLHKGNPAQSLPSEVKPEVVKKLGVRQRTLTYATGKSMFFSISVEVEPTSVGISRFLGMADSFHVGRQIGDQIPAEPHTCKG